ncbi:GCN5-related N-acetyltransferase [Methanosarcina siciliae T4/M]|uniref:GCN5-related N-acetyltransferase n=1 Tax=Methanosarcina siciliae T4/M TaxID=1434120 RepID=A0A0E3P1V6_9EURY|nr:GNAT family N-acetyltransferase [Methanosarcina siciliae]AKB27375.1 GCN5-related N-acetyltransferase [Methanosarcina siciliae T4/M]
MKYYMVPMSPEDRETVIDIFNHYIENSFAAYPEKKVPYEFFEFFLRNTAGYPTVAAKDENKNLLGFGMLHPHSPMPTLAGTAEITYFIRPEFTGKGIGAAMLGYLLEGAGEKGLHCILANISSLNDGSIRFHLNHGFEECGRFREVGKKKGKLFDTVWMQKLL